MPDNYPNQDINFRTSVQSEEGDLKFSNKIIDWAIKTGRKILLLVAFIMLITIGINEYTNRSLENYAQSAEDKSKIIEQMSEIEESHIVIQQKVSDIDAILNTQIDWRVRLEELNSFIPSDMVLDSVRYGREIIEISGTVNSAEGFGLFLNTLLNADEITSITISSGTYDHENENFNFTVKLTIDDLLMIEEDNNEEE